jgi:hypothetical protein
MRLGGIAASSSARRVNTVFHGRSLVAFVAVGVVHSSRAMSILDQNARRRHAVAEAAQRVRGSAQLHWKPSRPSSGEARGRLA